MCYLAISENIFSFKMYSSSESFKIKPRLTCQSMFVFYLRMSVQTPIYRENDPDIPCKSQQRKMEHLNTWNISYPYTNCVYKIVISLVFPSPP